MLIPDNEMYYVYSIKKSKSFSTIKTKMFFLKKLDLNWMKNEKVINIFNFESGF